MRENEEKKPKGKVYEFGATYIQDFGFGVTWNVSVKGIFIQKEGSDEIEGYVHEIRNEKPQSVKSFIRGTYNKTEEEEELLYIRAEYGNLPLVYAFFWKDGTGKYMAYDEMEIQGWSLPYNGRIQIQELTRYNDISSAKRKTFKKTKRSCRKGVINPIAKLLLGDYERARRHLRI